jgi:PAS domain S-box-containing protein
MNEAEIKSGFIKNHAELLLSIIPSGVFTIGPNQTITSWNKKAEEITGYSAEEMLGEQCFFSKFNECRQECCFFTGNFENKEQEGEYEFVAKDGSVKAIHKNVTYIYDDNGEFAGKIESFIDITDKKVALEAQKSYAEELKQLNASKDKFFSIISHDLRGPYHGFMGAADMLAHDMDNLSKEEIQQVTNQLYSGLKNQLRLLDNLLNWSRIQTDRLKFEPTRFELCPVVNEDMLSAKMSYAYKKIKITNNIENNLFVYADVNHVSLIMQNLISNAFKFSRNEGEIAIQAIRKGIEIEISVKDNGVGISKANMEKMFRIDVYYSSLGTMEETGTGLGLILSKELIEKNSGRIWVESNEKSGSTFYFTLPYSG